MSIYTAFRENLKKEPEAKEPRSIVGEAEPETAIRRPVNSKTPCPPNDDPSSPTVFGPCVLIRENPFIGG